jgi:hypothetical protein
MKNRKLKIALLSAMAIFIGCGYAMAYTVDGNVTDWGINLTAATAINYLDNHKPTGATVDVITEDNATAGVSGYQFVDPGWTVNGNTFDAEAIYFDNSQTTAYLAVISGFPSTGDAVSGYHFTYGDIGIDMADSNGIKDGIFEYAIDVSTYNAVNGTAKLYSGLTSSSWQKGYYSSTYPSFQVSDPWQVKSGNYTSQYIPFVYSGNQNNHYVMEAGIPLDYLDFTAPGNQNLTIHWTMQCGNDYLNLPASINAAPEPTSMVLLGIGLLGLAGLGKKKKNKDLI